jgi:hypothetical protein
MPIGFPATKSGVEIDLLKTVFTPLEARIATHLDRAHKTVAQVYETAQADIGSKEELAGVLDEMVAKGGYHPKRKGQ